MNPKPLNKVLDTDAAIKLVLVAGGGLNPEERDVFIDNLLVRIHLIIVMMRWTGLAPWDFEPQISR